MTPHLYTLILACVITSVISHLFIEKFKRLDGDGPRTLIVFLYIGFLLFVFGGAEEILPIL